MFLGARAAAGVTRVAHPLCRCVFRVAPLCRGAFVRFAAARFSALPKPGSQRVNSHYDLDPYHTIPKYTHLLTPRLKCIGTHLKCTWCIGTASIDWLVPLLTPLMMQPVPVVWRFLSISSFLRKKSSSTKAGTDCNPADGIQYDVFRDSVKCYEQCRAALSRFFLDFISEYIFSRSEPPSPAVIKKLLSFVTYPKRETTAELSPFPDEVAIDPSPVIRSYLLQQILKFEWDVLLSECLS